MKVMEMKNEIDQTRNEKNAQLKRLRNEQAKKIATLSTFFEDGFFPGIG